MFTNAKKNTIFSSQKYIFAQEKKFVKEKNALKKVISYM